MLSRPQQILIKRAQAEAGIDDADYRQALPAATGIPDCHSSKDPRLTDSHMDHILGYFEAIHWHLVEQGKLQPSSKPNAIFKQKGFWATRNPRGNTSRDRYTNADVTESISEAERQLAEIGYGPGYVATIRRNTPGARQYLFALHRTLRSKQARPSPSPGGEGRGEGELQHSNTPF